jgi:CheY-like chemotaxis protein
MKTDLPASARPIPLIYIVDDNPRLAEIAELILKSEGYRLRAFTDPRLALRSIRQTKSKPDLLVTDFAMDPMNGLELVESCRAIIPDLKVLLLSGTIAPEAVLNQPVRVNQFLGKPYRPSQLTGAVEALLK